MSKPVLGRGLGSLLGSTDNKNQSDASPKGVGLLLRGSNPSSGTPVSEVIEAEVTVTPVVPEPVQLQVTSPEMGRQNSLPTTEIAQSGRPTPISTTTPTVANEPVTPVEWWRNPIIWLVSADVFFVGLAGWIALSGHSPVRWIGVLILMLIAGSIGFIGYFFPSLGSSSAPVPEPKDKPKIRVHFVDELPKRRS